MERPVKRGARTAFSTLQNKMNMEIDCVSRVRNILNTLSEMPKVTRLERKQLCNERIMNMQPKSIMNIKNKSI